MVRDLTRILARLKFIKDTRDPLIIAQKQAQSVVDHIDSSVIQMDNLEELEGYRDLININFNTAHDFTHIVIHHSATRDTGTKSWDAIRRWHTGKIAGSPHKWRDIGYHFGVELIGKKVKILQGRPIHIQGAHAKNFNKVSVGICIVGNYDKIKPSKAHIEQALILTKWLMTYFNIPYQKVIGHREVYKILKQKDYKSCPGKLFNMSAFREELK